MDQWLIFNPDLGIYRLTDRADMAAQAFCDGQRVELVTV